MANTEASDCSLSPLLKYINLYQDKLRCPSKSIQFMWELVPWHEKNERKSQVLSRTIPPQSAYWCCCCQTHNSASVAWRPNHPVQVATSIAAAAEAYSMATTINEIAATAFSSLHPFIQQMLLPKHEWCVGYSARIHFPVIEMWWERTCTCPHL